MKLISQLITGGHLLWSFFYSHSWENCDDQSLRVSRICSVGITRLRPLKNRFQREVRFTVTCSLLMTGISINQCSPVDKRDQLLSLVWMQETDVAFRRFCDVSWTCEGFCQPFFLTVDFLFIYCANMCDFSFCFWAFNFCVKSNILLVPSTYDLTLFESLCQFACERLTFCTFRCTLYLCHFSVFCLCWSSCLFAFFLSLVRSPSVSGGFFRWDVF